MTNPSDGPTAMKIRFPCGNDYIIGEQREEWRLKQVGRDAWGGWYPNVRRAGREMRIALSEGRIDICYVRPVPGEPIYAGGYWPHGRAAALLLSKDGEDLILRAYDAHGTPGPNYIPELDDNS